MEGEPAESEASLFPATVGEKLRAAREAQGLGLAEIAASTRIPQRHLEAIEKGNYASLPSITYALGFAKAYARAVGADEVAIGRDVRGEIGGVYDQRQQVPVSYDLEESGRRAPSGVVWIMAIIALVLAIGAGVWYGTNLFRGSAPPPESLVIPDATPSAAATDAATTPETGGQVSLIALDTVWLAVTDGTGKKLFEAEMKPGERYDVPQGADHPRAKTGRPDKIQVTLNGSNVPPLADGAVTVNVEVSADAIRARGQPGAEPTPGVTPIPASTAATISRERRTRTTRATQTQSQPTLPVVTTPTPIPAGNNTAP